MLACLPVVSAWGDARALLISSYHPAFPTFFQQIGGLREVLAPAGVELDIEFMDTKRFSLDEAVARTGELLRFKLDRLGVHDVIVAADDAALHFVLKYRDELFEGRPVVFLGINDQNIAHDLSGTADFTGVIESVSMIETLEDIRRLLPHVTAVHAVVDAQPGGQADLRTFLAQWEQFPELHLDIIALNSMTWKELGRRLSSLSDSDAILLLSAYSDGVGVRKSFKESLAFILGHAPVPVFHLWEHGLGVGIVGGKVVSHTEQGRLAGELVLRILGGEAAKSLPVIEGDAANRHVFDYAALKRFGIDESRLPPGSEVRGRPISLLSRYMPQLFVAAVFLGVLILLLAGLFLHVCRLRRAKARIAESEARYKALFDASADGILVAEATTRRFLFANPAVCRMFGHPVDEFVKLGVEDIHPGEYLDRVLADFESQVRGEKDIAEGSPCLRSDGSVFWADIRSFSLDIDGKPCGVGLFRDVTERLQTLAFLHKARNAAEEANRSKSEFLANMSHEIRTPLNGVTGMLQLLEGTSPTDEQREHIDLALTSAMRLTRLLSDILDLSRIEAGKLVMESRPFSLEELRESTLSLLSMAAREKGLSLEFELDASLPEKVIGDQTRLQQIMFNLAGNGIKFTERGGIRIHACPLLITDDAQARVLFTVADTGVGISDDLLTKIFHPFEQGETSYVRTSQGAGLGLSIVRRLVRLMGGTLAVENRSDGTIFYLSLPFALPEEPVSPDFPQVGPERGIVASKRFLVVEDDEISSQTVTLMLERCGHRVVTVGNGQEALNRLRKECFDVVLMDIQMPVMDGLEATRRIRGGACPDCAVDIPVVAMTAYAMSGDREKCLAAGMDDYVPKPVSLDDLMRVVAKLSVV